MTLQQVREFAAEAHRGQTYGDQPYTHHLEAVADVVRRFGHSDPALIDAAWLHDVVEDTEATLEDIKKVSLPGVSDIVYRVTDEDGKNRRERKALTYPKIRDSVRAIIIKLADRIANIESCIENDRTNLLEMYRKEHAEFRSALYREDDRTDSMWKHLGRILEG